MVFKSELKQSERQINKHKSKRYKLPSNKKCTALKGDMLYHDYTNRAYVNAMYPFDDMPSECVHKKKQAYVTETNTKFISMTENIRESVFVCLQQFPLLIL